MTHIEVKGSRVPDEVRPFAAHGRAEVVKLGEHSVMRVLFEPGWRWSQDVKPIAGTEWCEANHFGYCISGRMAVKTRDGEEVTFGPGDFFSIEPGHDAWVVGDEPCIAIDFGGYEQYARRSVERVAERAPSPPT